MPNETDLPGPYALRAIVVIEPGTLPYFDFLLALLEQRNAAVEKSFGTHVHWGYWPDCRRAVGDDADYAQAAERLTRELCDMAEVKSGCTVLDVGCGFGGTVQSLNHRFPELALIGLNIDHRQLVRANKLVARAEGNTVTFCQGNASKLPFADGSVDRVLAVECVFHFPSREAFFHEAFRVLKPGGVLALSDFVPAALFRPVARIATEAKALARFQYFGNCNLQFTIGSYRKLAAATGFVPLSERDVTGHTLPTYDYLQRLLGGTAAIEGITDKVVGLLGLLKGVAALGLLRYYLLAYRKPTSEAYAAA